MAGDMLYKIDMFFGTVKTRAWFEREGDRLIGMGEAVYSDGRRTAGETGVVLTGDPKELDRLGKFYGR
jgi:hypothetical protein